MIKLSVLKCIFYVFVMAFPSLAKASPYMGSVDEVRIEWTQPISINLPDNESKQVLNHLYAHHESIHQYLPVIRIKLNNVLVDSISVVYHESTSFSSEETFLLDAVDWNLVPLSNIRNYYYFNQPISEIDVVPIDTSGGFYKPKSITINYYYNHSLSGKVKYNYFKNHRINSVLAEGDWFKIGVLNDGVHKITADFLQKSGININQINPKQIRIFGNGGKVLPQSNDVPVPLDLVENSIHVVGEEDGRFDPSDFILFYGQCPHRLEHADGSIIYEHHPYSDTTFYFLNIGSEPGRRMTISENLQGSFPEITFSDHLQVHKKNLKHILTTSPNNIGGSGRNWYGEDFTPSKREAKVTFNVNGIKPNSEVTIVSSLAASSRMDSEYTVRMGNQVVGKQYLNAIIDGEYFDKASLGTNIFKAVIDQVPSNGNLIISLTYDNPVDHRTIGFLDYLLLHWQRDLSLNAPQLIFTSLSSLNFNTSKFVIKSFNESSLVWDITDGLSPMTQQVKHEGNIGAFSTPTDHLKKFVVFDSKAALPSPVFAGKISNQNLHGNETPNLLIVTHNDFLSEAQRLADFRRSYDGYSVVVSTVDQVYNEFSSGAQDVTAIRNYVKYLYDRGGKNGLKHVLLFGKPSYDFKNIKQEGKQFVPTYESRNSSHPISSYSSDDYFGFMGETEGEWEENFTGDHSLDVGVGRLPMTSLADARIMVDKLIHYSSSHTTFGDWRKQVYFVADDEDNNLHINDAEKLVNQIEAAYPHYDMNKIYLDAYPQVGKPNERSPETTRAINEMIEKGAFMVNFIGHGSPYLWMDEQVLTIPIIHGWKNVDKLPLFVTATCQFGRMDDPAIVSGAEHMLFHPNHGGAIGMVTTGRPVYASSNYNLNRILYQAIFERLEDGMPTLGEVFRYTKNNSLQGVNNRSFSLLGDPSMTLAYPKKEIKITSITTSDNEETDTIKALQKIKVTGEIQSGGLKYSDFDGIVHASIFDKKSTVTTYGDKGTPTTFKQWDNLIFNGGGTVKGGTFTFEFIAPKNISYQIDHGKMSLYAFDSKNKKDAFGSEAKIKIGGSILNAPIDSKPPEVKLYMNDTLFRDGGLTGSSPLFIARLFDENGINISNNGIGQEMTASLNGDPPIKLNHFYKGVIDDYRQGWVRYPLNDLENGRHEIVFKAWDVYNNSTEARLSFVISNKKGLEIKKLISSPNPFREATQLSFEHNRSGDDLKVWAQLYSIRGELITTLKYEIKSSNSVVYLFNWDGSGVSGKKLETGLYIFKVFVRSLEDGSESSMTTKITLFN